MVKTILGFPENQPVLALAPMQDITNLAFMRIMASFGGADVYFTEYFRVTENGKPEAEIIRSITENPTGQPIVAQLIGNHLDSMKRYAEALLKLPVAGIDLNLGCPAPIVYKKCAGGGLLRDLERASRLIAWLREVVTPQTFSVKTRIGFSSNIEWSDILSMLSQHDLDWVTVHGRTVAQRYADPVDYDAIGMAAAKLQCPVIANGSLDSPQHALSIWQNSGAAGLMLGRSAIRNPWLFQQIRQALAGDTIVYPRGHDVLDYIGRLYCELGSPNLPEVVQVQMLKKHLNFLGLGIGQKFLHEIRRVNMKSEFFVVCERWLSHDNPLKLEPFVAA
ncbi:MAG: tRNA dihydrouridine synthase [Verrucomicrobiales bacterium]